MTLDEGLLKEVQRKGVSRLCHFTPVRNLMHLIDGKIGILATEMLERDERALFTQIDIERWDGRKGHISTSIQYPNVHYFLKKQKEDLLFRDWVILLIRADYVGLNDTLYCPHNAAKGSGANLIPASLPALAGLYASRVGSFSRSATHLSSCPTDMQCEVMVKDKIAITDLTGVVFPTKAHAQDQLVRFEYAKIDCTDLRFVICGEMFDKDALRNCIWNGSAPRESTWTP